MKQWYVVRSKPKKEATAASFIARSNVEVYVPWIKVPVAGGKPPVRQPFFPGYFFSRLDPTSSEVTLVRYSPGVQYLLGYGDHPWPVPDDLVQTIKERLEREGGRGRAVVYRAGERVVITRGPLEGVEAIFDRHLSPDGRVRVLIQIVQRLCRAELHVSQLRPTHQAAVVVVR